MFTGPSKLHRFMKPFSADWLASKCCTRVKILRQAFHLCMELKDNMVVHTWWKPKSFLTRTGLKQRDAAFQVQFNLVLEKKIIRILKNKPSITKGQILGYANDIAIVGETLQGPTKVFKHLIEHAEKVGLEINLEKTEYTRRARSKNKHEDHTQIDRI